LKKVSLKFEAIEKLLHGKLPVHLKSAHIGRLLVKIPWANLTTEAVRVVLEDVYFVATPRKLTPFDEKQENDLEKSARKALLSALDKPRVFEDAAKAATSEENIGFIQALIFKIVDNIQIEINRVHIVYQDDGESPGVREYFISIIYFILFYVILFYFYFL